MVKEPIQLEMMALVGGCVQDHPNYLIPEVMKGEFKKIVTGHFNLTTTPEEGKKYDLIIEFTPSDPAEVEERLSEVGIYITVPTSLTDTALFSSYSQRFEVVLPYYYFDRNYHLHPLLFASKKYHPTADLIRHRSDFVEDCCYYNTDIHLAAFVYPNHLWAVIKNSVKP